MCYTYVMKSTQSGSTNLTTILFLIFLTLKLTGVIDWSWWWVTAPLWIPVGLILGVGVLLGVGLSLYPRLNRFVRQQALKEKQNG